MARRVSRHPTPCLAHYPDKCFLDAGRCDRCYKDWLAGGKELAAASLDSSLIMTTTIFCKDLITATFLAVAALIQIADAVQAVCTGMLRGLHDTRWPMVFAVTGYTFVGIGTGAWLAFSRGWQGLGIWAGLASGIAVVAALVFGRWLLRDRLGPTP